MLWVVLGGKMTVYIWDMAPMEDLYVFTWPASVAGHVRIIWRCIWAPGTFQLPREGRYVTLAPCRTCLVYIFVSISDSQPCAAIEPNEVFDYGELE